MTPTMQLSADPGLKPTNDDEFWAAVQSRDYNFYSSFVYGVSTTKIFCRPTCPSRRPTRDMVTFFGTPSDAVAAGYRACRRCRPDLSDQAPVIVRAVQKACTFIEENYGEKISVSRLAEIAGLSPFHFHRNFHKITGVTPKEYVESVRIKHAKLALKNGMSARNSTYRAGHNSAAWLYSDSGASRLGMTPAVYKSGGSGLEISYLISPCTLGRILVAGTQKGICFVGLGDTDAELENYLKVEFPRAKLSRGAGVVDAWMPEILNYLEGKSRLGESQLPLDIASTAFQMRVWRELQGIPYGKTLSYNEIAEKIGHPKAYRAVANACGSNRVPLVIPCHRVVRKNGDLGGYRYGIGRKKKLLEMEAKNSDP